MIRNNESTSQLPGKMVMKARGLFDGRTSNSVKGFNKNKTCIDF